MSTNLIFRGAQVRNGTFAIEDGGLVYRHKLAADITRAFADRMGWSLYEETENGIWRLRHIGVRDGKTLALDGEIQIADWKLAPNGMKQHNIEGSGKELRDFELSWRQAKEEGDPDEVEMRFKLVTDSSLENYLRIVGDASAQLKINALDDTQLKLSEQDTEEAEEAETEPVGAAMASAGEMKRKARTN